MSLKSIRQVEIVQQLNKYDWSVIRDYCNKNDYRCLIVHHEKEGNNHFHAYIKFDSPVPISNLTKQLNIEEQYLQSIKNWKNALAYAFHLGNTSKEEELDESCILWSNRIIIYDIFNGNEKIKEANRDEEIKQLFYDYGDLKITKKQLLNELTPQLFDKYSKLYNNMIKYRQMKVSDRQMKVVYIYGESGTGKTTLAKFFAKSYNYDYFVTGSGKDPLDGYDKEECLIFDDLRGDTFTKAELFKLLDNNTNSSVKSRYCNKDISNCKLLIITSVKSPISLYDWSVDSTTETFKQLSRRLGNECCYVARNGCILIQPIEPDSVYINSKMSKHFPYTMEVVYCLLGIDNLMKQSGLSSIMETTAEIFNSKRDEIAQKQKEKYVDTNIGKLCEQSKEL